MKLPSVDSVERKGQYHFTHFIENLCKDFGPMLVDAEKAELIPTVHCNGTTTVAGTGGGGGGKLSLFNSI